MRALAILFALSGCFTSSLPEPAPEMPAPTVSVVGQALDSTVALVTDEGRSFCAGVFVRGYILTANHCMPEEGEEVLFQIRGLDSRFKSRIAAHSETTDLAILSPTQVLPPHAESMLAPSDPELGAAVVVIGHPLGYRWFITNGLSQGVRTQPDGDRWFMFSAPVMYGNSGGPVFNEYGEVVGIVSWLAWNRMDNIPITHIAAGVPLEVLEMGLSGAH